MKIHHDNAGHMTKMAAMLIYSKNTLKIFYPGTTGLILMKLCMKLHRTKPFIFFFKLLPFVDLDLFYGKVKFCKLS